MPKVKQAAFCYQTCGAVTRVQRTRAATSSRLIRYRVCAQGHRLTTREVPVTDPATVEKSIGTTRVEIALRHLAADLGISIDSASSPALNTENHPHEHDAPH